MKQNEKRCIEALKALGYTIYIWENGQIVISNETDKNPFDNEYSFSYQKDFIACCKKYKCYYEAYDAGTIFIGSEAN